MGLPDSALRKLAAEFRGANGRPRPTLRESHTLPIRRDRWNAYAQPFDELIHDFAETVAQADGLYADFAETRSWLARTTEIKRQIISMLLALAPFTYFDVDRATRLMNRLEQAVVEVAAAVEQRRRPNTDPPAVRGTQDTWAAAVDEEDDYRFGVAFGLDFDPVNEDREFQASLVLSAYRYQNSVMAAQVLPHLASLGVPRETMPNDILAGVSIVGWIVGSQDPVVAATLDDLLGALLNPASRQVADSVLAMFAERENITRQVRRKVASSLAQIGPDQDLEQRALILADVYKSLVEGPVRQFGWALFSLESGSWSAPPTLTPMRDSLVAHGGFIGQLAEACIIPKPTKRPRPRDSGVGWDPGLLPGRGRLGLPRPGVERGRNGGWLRQGVPGCAGMLSSPPPHARPRRRDQRSAANAVARESASLLWHQRSLGRASRLQRLRRTTALARTRQCGHQPVLSSLAPGPSDPATSGSLRGLRGRRRGSRDRS